MTLSREKMREYMRERRASGKDKEKLRTQRRELKREFVSLKGGKCQRCGWTPGPGEEVALDFHHRDPAEKLFSIAPSATRSLESLTRELEKCDMLCANCHRIVEAEQVPTT